MLSRSVPLALRGHQWVRAANFSSKSYAEPLIQIHNGTFYRRHPAAKSVPGTSPNLPLFSNLNLYIPSFSSPNQNWAILSPSSVVRTTFLQVLRGQLICDPPTARSYPYLVSPENPRHRFPEKALLYVGFDAERQAYGGAYLSARYESRVEVTDFSLEQYLTGITGLNVGEEFIKEKTPDRDVMLKVVEDLELAPFFTKPVSTLSNGQSRRARIGKALLNKPEMLLLDAPFIGLDPYVTDHISKLLHRLAEASEPRILISLRPQDTIPEWITHLIYVGEDSKVKCQGEKSDVFRFLQEQYQEAEALSARIQGAQKGTPWESKESNPKSEELSADALEMREVGRHLAERGDFEFSSSSPQGRELSRDGFPATDLSPVPLGEPVVEMEGVNIKYGTNSVLGNWQQSVDGVKKQGLWWTVRRGQRWGVFGANGSGKTTLLSLITSDHPQTYSAPVKIFRRSRLPSLGNPGISIFDIQAHIGHASPEVHSLFPKSLTIRRALESAWADTPITKPRLTEETAAKVDAILRWFAQELNPSSSAHEGTTSSASDLDWAEKHIFADLSFSSQRVALFLRSFIHCPEILILDEAFSGMDDMVRDKCQLFLSHGENMTLHYDAHLPYPIPVESEAKKNGTVKVGGLKDEQALLCVSHTREDVPGCIREWICLQESGKGEPRLGRLDGPLEMDRGRWNEIWGSNGK